MEIKFKLYSPVIDTNPKSIDCINNHKGYISQILKDSIKITWKQYNKSFSECKETSTIYTKEYINFYIKSDLETIRNDKIQQLLYYQLYNQENENRNLHK